MKRLFSFAIIAVISCCCVSSSQALSDSTINTLAQSLASQAKNLNPKVVQLALQAFSNATSTGIHPTKQILTIIDYSIPSTEKRLWVLDLEHKQILYTSLVAHGKYSGDNYTTNFSNKMGSLETSLGLFLTKNTYFGRDGYSLNLQGLEVGFNDKALERRIVMHGAPYVSEEFAATMGRVGHSWGCPAVEKPLAAPIINTIKNGTLVFSYYPDHTWLEKSKFISHEV